MKKVLLTITIFLSFNLVFANENVQELKNKIITIASKYEGKGDPDFKIQNELEPYVNQLIKLAPQKPIKERLPVLAGLWKQVWGPYDYRNDNRGVDPTLDVKEIYQYVSSNGYYYNISPQLNKRTGKEESIGYLKGEYEFSDTDENSLNVHFVKFPGMKTRPTDREFYDFVAEAEADALPNQKTIVPTWIVKLFFRGGSLIEVYTDNDVRILYGSNKSDFKNKYLYVMKRVN